MGKKKLRNKSKKLRKLCHHQNWLCCYCDLPIEIRPINQTEIKDNHATIDHIIPQRRGGGNSFANLAASCYRCNNEKGSSIWPVKIKGNIVMWTDTFSLYHIKWKSKTKKNRKYATQTIIIQPDKIWIV
jgi:CRISPR/Cas system Type II protein with McrA/HNH and RuvC-like nuclease domain